MSYWDDIERAKLQIREVTNDTLIDVTLRIHATLVANPPDGTPIDLGWASANWFINIGSPTTGNGGRADSGSLGSREAAQASSVAQFVSGYDYTRGQTIHVGNNVPYIARLNAGWSNQSPAGFVDDATQEAVVWANNQGTVKI